MDKKKHFTSNGFGVFGAVLFIAGILVMMAGDVAVGAVFWALANCMFLVARHLAKTIERKHESKVISNEKID